MCASKGFMLCFFQGEPKKMLSPKTTGPAKMKGPLLWENLDLMLLASTYTCLYSLYFPPEK